MAAQYFKATSPMQAVAERFIYGGGLRYMAWQAVIEQQTKFGWDSSRQGAYQLSTQRTVGKQDGQIPWDGWGQRFLGRVCFGCC